MGAVATLLIVTRVAALPVTGHSANFVVALRGLTPSHFTTREEAFFAGVVAAKAGDVCAGSCTSNNVAINGVANSSCARWLSVRFSVFTDSFNASSAALDTLSKYMATSAFLRDLVASGDNLASITAINVTTANITDSTSNSHPASSDPAWWVYVI